MKVIVSKDNLLQGINIVQKAVSPKSTLAILEGILLEADENFKLTGNDLEIGIECNVESDIIEKGSIVISSKLFGEIVRRLPDAEVSLEVKENNTVTIECENSYFELKGVSSEGFPSIQQISRDKVFKIKEKLLREMIRQTIFSVSVDENRPILNGSLLMVENNEFYVVAIDGFRLSLRRYNLNDTEEFGIVVPGKTLNEVIKILQPDDEEISVYVTENQVMFELKNCRILSRLIEGKYLNFKSIIPSEYETKIRINTKELLYSIERASLMMVDEKKHPVKFSISEDMLIIQSNTEIGNVREEIRVEIEGSKIEIGFNPRYFIEALKNIEDEEVNVYFTSNVGPCTIKPIEKDNYVYMILPVRIKAE